MHNCAFMHNCYNNRAYMQGYCSMCICYYINFCSHLIFSLFSMHNQRTQFSSPYFLFPQMHTNKHTHTHTQTNPHGQTNRETDRSSWVLIDAWLEHVGLDRWLIGACGSWLMLDRSLWVLIGAWLELGGLDCCLTGTRLDRCLWNNWSSWVFCLNGARGS